MCQPQPHPQHQPDPQHQRPTAARPREPGQYAIHVAGHLDRRWAQWFDGLTLTHRDDGTTVLEGPVVDQTALHGLLHKVRDLGLSLLSVTPAPATTTTTPSPTTGGTTRSSS